MGGWTMHRNVSLANSPTCGRGQNKNKTAPHVPTANLEFCHLEPGNYSHVPLHIMYMSFEVWDC
jgi:hypothetical protein